MKKIITLALIALFPFLLEAQNTWEKKTSFPASKRARFVAFSIASRGYIVGGEDTLDIEKNDCWEYDPGSDSWTQKANLPGPGRRDAVGFSIGQKGYCGTGIDAPDAFMGNVLNDFWEYSPITNTWTQKASYPGGQWVLGVYFATGFAINGKGYVCCGKEGASTYNQQLWEFNPATNSWLQKAMYPPGARYGQMNFVLNGKAYVGCGTDENWFTNDFWEYNPVTNGWIQKATFPGTSRAFGSAFSVGGKGYMGMGTDGGFKDDWFVYDEPSNSWNPAATYGSEGRRSAPAFVISGAGYVVMGKGVSGKHRDMWEYKPYVTGMDEFGNVTVNVYPNPSTEMINFDFEENFAASENDLSVQLFSINGKMMLEQKVNGNAHVTLKNENWASGEYIYSITNGTKIFSKGHVIVL